MNFPLQYYLDTHTDLSLPDQGSPPGRREWIDFAEFILKGRRLCFSDSWCPFDGVAVELPVGRYAVKALCFTYGFFIQVAALRVEMIGASGELGAEIGQFYVDVGAVGITDLDLIESLSEENYEEWITAYSYAENKPAAGAHPCQEADTEMLFSDCGWGDGEYSVFGLEQAGIVVGAEVRFLEENEPYPFPYENSKNEYECYMRINKAAK